MMNFAVRVLALLGVMAVWGQAALAQGSPPAVGVVELAPADVPYERLLAGRAVAFERSEIRPRVSGAIEEILYRPGLPLNAGDPMFRIEDVTYRAAVASAKASVAGAAAELATAEATAERYRALQGRAASATDLQNAQLAVAKAAAALASAQANLETAEMNLDYTVIKSPIAGVAAVSTVTVGTLVTAAQSQALTTVTRLDPIYVDVSDSSAGILRVRDRVASGELRPGDRIGLRLFLETGTPYDREGELVSTSAEVQSTTGTVDMRIQFDNPDRLILPGQFLRVKTTLGTTRALLVPQRATTRGLDGSLKAWVVREDKVHRVDLVTTGSFENAWITTQGVVEGDILAVDNLTNLREGQSVKTVRVEIDPLGVVREIDAKAEN